MQRYRLNVLQLAPRSSTCSAVAYADSEGMSYSVHHQPALW